MPWSGQNPGSKGLRGKILRNKELAQVGLAAWVPNCFGVGRTIRLCAFYSLGQGCSSHAADFLFCAELWKTAKVAPNAIANNEHSE
jgi:hypothetical protein